MKFKIFLSSPRKEFENERFYLKRKIEEDFVLNHFFEVFSFEETSASRKNPVELYSHEIINSDIYIGLVGSDYGSVLESGISPTEYEYNLFNRAHNDALLFIKNCETRDEKVYTFIDKIDDEHSYKTFNDLFELYDEVKRSLCNFLEKNLVDYRAYDSQLLLDSSCDDVDMEAVETFFRVCDNKALKDLRNDKGLDYILSSINAGEFHDGEFKLNVAGALFFAKDISKFNIAHEVKMVKFIDSKNLDNVEKVNSNKSLLSLLHEALIFLDNNTHHVLHIEGFERDTIDEYPEDAIREALVNAIAHRDYSITSAPITFYIYRNKIEIKSPGRLEFPLKVSDLESHDPIHRNKMICSIFSQTKYMEHIGTGIKRMKDAMIDSGLREPKLEEEGEFFKVTFYGRDFLNRYVKLNERQLAFMENEKSEISITEYVEMFKVSRNTARADLNYLVGEMLVKKFKVDKSYIYKKT
jgi:hypothetical protein